MNYRYPLFILVLLSLALCTKGQYYDTGEDPASVKWLQVKTGRFRVIYPESYGEQGIKYARMLEEAYRKVSVYYPGLKVKIPVIIHNYTTTSNGYVAWAPKRMEIYPTPEQNTIPLDNTEQLTLHEMAHVMQMSSLSKDLSKFLYIPFGEQYYGVLAAYLPVWFMEGDAVLMETFLSESGRGRTPSFNKQLKAISAGRGKMYSYDKMLLGSLRNYTPDEYRYGYRMIAWSDSVYGHRIWNNALKYTAKFPFSLYPVNISLNKDASLTKEKLFRLTFSREDSAGHGKGKDGAHNQYDIVNKPKGREYINYFSPAILGSDSVAVIKVTMYNPPEIILLNPSTKEEKRIIIPGNIYPYFLSGAEGKIVWVENIRDPRWDNRQFSVVKLLDLEKGKVVQLSRQTRYLAAAISPDGRFVAAVENSLADENAIVIIDAFNGDILSSVKVPGGIYPQRPQWSASGNEITFISLSTGGEGIISLSVNDKQWKTLKSPCRDDLQASFLRNDTLFFISSASSTDNLWLLTPEGYEKRVSGSRFGMYDITVSGNNIYFTDYSFSGSNICRLSLNDLKNECPSPSGPFSFRLNTGNADKITQAEPAKDYTPEPYRKWMHLFRFHSWMPFYADIDELQSDPSAIKPGLTLFSQNHLSTLITALGYEYSGGSHLLHTRLRWKGWYPVFESQIDYGGVPDVIKPVSGASDPSVLYSAMHFTNKVYLPLSFSTGNFTQYLYTSLRTRYSNRYVYLKEIMAYDYGQTEVTGRIFISNYSRSGMRDIFPRWAQLLDFSYTSFPADNNIYGPMSTLRGAIYFPGFIRNHGIRLRYETDFQKPVKLLLYNRAAFPRGYDNIISQKLEFLSADYVMPLVYPDFNLPGMLYVKRIRAGLFYDYARGTRNTYLEPSVSSYVNGTETFRSFGTELLADFHLLRIPFMISGGMQASWKNMHEAPSVKLLLNLDIYGMMIGRYRMD